MKANLTLFYSNNVKLNLIENEELDNIDNFTIRYTDKDNLKQDPLFINEISDFYGRYTNYINSIKKKEDKIANLYLTYRDEFNSIEKLNVLYKNDKDKTNFFYLVNKIEDTLKKRKDCKLLIDIYQKFGYFLKSEFNYNYYHIGTLLNRIKVYDIASSQREYNKLIFIIKTELLKNCNKKENIVSNKSYFYARIIDSYIVNKSKVKSFGINNLKLNEENINSKSKITKKKKEGRKTSYHGMGDYFLYDDEEDEKKWRK